MSTVLFLMLTATPRTLCSTEAQAGRVGDFGLDRGFLGALRSRCRRPAPAKTKQGRCHNVEPARARAEPAREARWPRAAAAAGEMACSGAASKIITSRHYRAISFRNCRPRQASPDFLGRASGSITQLAPSFLGERFRWPSFLLCASSTAGPPSLLDKDNRGRILDSRRQHSDPATLLPPPLHLSRPPFRLHPPSTAARRQVVCTRFSLLQLRRS